MIEVKKETEISIEKALLVGVKDIYMSSDEAREHLLELSELARTLGIPERPEILIVLHKINPKYFIGSGKAREIANFAKEIGANCIIFDSELSPSQQRNLEELSGLAVVDRQELIIDIFAARARTKEAAIQVELARFQYYLPRLKRAWTHLSRQKGGALGTKGEGEQQIEVDRRIVRKKIVDLQESLMEIRKRRDVQKTLAEKNDLPKVAIVGYTNAGKSSVLKAMTGAELYIEDKLFATLDTTTRKLELPDAQIVLASDTVGFIRKLPHTLVEAFKSTLDEVLYADVLVNVLDASSLFWEEHLETTITLIRELGAGEKEVLTVLNKSDLLTDTSKKNALRLLFPRAIFASAKTGDGILELKNALSVLLRKFSMDMLLKIPAQRHDIAALAHRLGKVISIEYEKNGDMKMSVKMPKIYQGKFLSYYV
jgi:GTP-binding protein HflX